MLVQHDSYWEIFEELIVYLKKKPFEMMWLIDLNFV